MIYIALIILIGGIAVACDVRVIATADGIEVICPVHAFNTAEGWLSGIAGNWLSDKRDWRYSSGDMTYDGRVDLADLALLAAVWPKRELTEIEQAAKKIKELLCENG